MGTFKATADKTVGKLKEAVAEILGDGQLREEAKIQKHKGHEEESDSGGLKPLGNLDRLT
jgi:uncharacterized protein YjbJ (UPF0337 family)